jgi:hypothetical protein
LLVEFDDGGLPMSFKPIDSVLFNTFSGVLATESRWEEGYDEINSSDFFKSLKRIKYHGR